MYVSAVFSLRPSDLSAVTISDGSSPYFDDETLLSLIARASANLDSDRATAEECIQRAAELLNVFRKERPATSVPMRLVRGGLTGWQRKRLVAYVEANVGANIRTIDLAHLAGLSKGHFFRAFRESFGEPPMAYVLKQRIRHGQELMRKSKASLCEIALACGMCDQPHFTRSFHRLVGVSPGLWRRQFASGPEGVDWSAQREMRKSRHDETTV